MDEKTKVLEIINNLRLEKFRVYSVESKHEDSLFEAPSSAGYLEMKGNSKVSFSEPFEQIHLNTTITVVASHESSDPDESSDEKHFSLKVQYELVCGFYDDKHLLLSGVEMTPEDFIPLLNNLSWPPIRQHLMDNLSAASFSGVSLPYFLPADVIDQKDMLAK